MLVINVVQPSGFVPVMMGLCAPKWFLSAGIEHIGERAAGFL